MSAKAEKEWQQELAFLEHWSAIFEEIEEAYDRSGFGDRNPHPIPLGTFIDVVLDLGVQAIRKCGVAEVLDYEKTHACPECGVLMAERHGCLECRNKRCLVIKVLGSGKVVKAAAL